VDELSRPFLPRPLALKDSYGLLTLAMHDLNLLLSHAFYPGGSGHPSRSDALRRGSPLALAGWLLLAGAGQLPADQVELQNGDRYVGHVLSLNTNAVVLRSEVLGTLRLPRSKVAVITFGPVPPTNSAAPPIGTNAGLPKPAAVLTNAASGVSPALKGMSVHTNLIQQVQKQFLSDAGPEANAKFNELLGGLLTGKLSVDDIRAQAKTAADQLRVLQRESGEDGGLASGVYLSILDHFLKETAPPGSATKAPPSATQPKAEADQEEN
jgi:hypothetical protein